jgi:hypothetical protein
VILWCCDIVVLSKSKSERLEPDIRTLGESTAVEFFGPEYGRDGAAGSIYMKLHFVDCRLWEQWLVLKKRSSIECHKECTLSER